ncbi:MAG: hypothetical protein HKN50_02085 [Gammaproteobacteria bacterium]|nr:hypothetical protein [Gammaproteobacteria bacterium]
MINKQQLAPAIQAVVQGLANMGVAALVAVLILLPAQAQIKDEPVIEALDIDPASAADPAPKKVDVVTDVETAAGRQVESSAESAVQPDIANNAAADRSVDQRDLMVEDTEFGEFLYNEASDATKLEMLRLLTKDTPATMVFLHAVSMGLGVEDVMQAAIRYQPEKGREFARSAVSILPLLTKSERYRYSRYSLDEANQRIDGRYPTVMDVASMFFEERATLSPRPDWLRGRYHMMASAAELQKLHSLQANKSWYYRPSTAPAIDRPVFVALYEHDKSMLVDGVDRISTALAEDGDAATVPVVFIYNRQNERSIENLAELDYPMTVKGVQQAYAENSIMVTPSPEWERGDYHLHAQIDELYELFEIPAPNQFEEQQWQRLLTQAKQYKEENISLIIAVLTGDSATQSAALPRHDEQYAALTDPRNEIAASFKSSRTSEEGSMELDAVLGEGLILNRPDIVAAFNALDEQTVPVVFYYLDENRTKAFHSGARAIEAMALGAGAPAAISGGGGGFGAPPPVICASPPCN